MRKILTAGGVLVITALAIAATNINDDFHINVNIPDYCQFSSANLNEDISFTIEYNINDNSHRIKSGSNTNNYQFNCIQGSTFSISATSINDGKLVHENDSNYYITYQLNANVQDSNYNTIGQSSDLFTTPINAVAQDQNLNLGINAVNLISFPSNPLAGNYTDTVTLIISY